MSFQVVCTGCGAPSSPSVGICPFCKTVMTLNDGKEKHNVDTFVKLYHDGKLDRALSLGTEMHKQSAELKTSIAFILPFVKVLIESEAPSSKIRSVLAEAHLAHPENTEIIDYLDLVEAKNNLRKGPNDLGEIAIKSLIRRSPNNIHAHFILATHLYWVDSQITTAIPHLEVCVRSHPNFLRAWGCLGAIYKKLGNHQLAEMAFRKCASIETNQSMKEFFEEQAKAC